MCIIIDENTHEIQTAGYLKQEIIDMLGISFPVGEVKIYPGAIKHIKNTHPDAFIKYFQDIPSIIENPDYVGVHPKEPNSIELVKVINEDVLVAIKLDPKGYLFVSSMYDLTPQKVPKRLLNGRLKPTSKI